MSRRNLPVETHRFAEALLSKPNEFVKFWTLGRFVLVWDTGRRAEGTIETDELFGSREHTEAHPDQRTGNQS